MGGDLNLKKSWHPSLMTNQKKVWEEEKKALDERKKIDQIMKERAEERQLQELEDLQESAGGRKRQARVDWMYSGPSSGQVGTTEEMEGYLLGKRRIDGLLKGTEKEKLQKSATEETFMAVQNANTLRDTAAKIREDPMLAIKKQEQAAYEAMMKDPVKRRLLLKAAGKDEPDAEREHKRRKHRHHHRSHRDERDRHEKSRNYRDEDEDRNGRSKHRRRRYTPTESRSRSRSPPRRSDRSPSPTRRRRSYTPEERRRPRSRSRSYSPPRRTNSNGVRKMQSWHSSRPERRYSRSPRRDTQKDNADEERRAVKLAAMQQDATELDTQRERRLAELAEREKADRERDDAARMRNAKHGGRADFVDRFHKKAGDMTLGQRMGKNGVSQKGDDE